MSESSYTGPERSAEFQHAWRVKKRMDERRKKLGTCCICRFREVTFGIYHCRNNVARNYPMCDRDGRTPRFEFDETTLGDFEYEA